MEITIRHISPSDLDRYSLPGSPPGFKQLLRQAWETGESRPAWCFSAWDGAQPAAHLCLRGAAGDPRVLEVFGLAGDLAKTGDLLLAACLESIPTYGTRALQAEIPARMERTAVLFRRHGFQHLEDRLAYTWDDPWPAVQESERLHFETLEECGVEIFTRLIQGTLARSHEKKLAQSARIKGYAAAAVELFDFFQTQNQHAHWWQAAYTQHGDPVGVVIPVLHSPREGWIGWLGVLPEERGHRYGRDLLARGTAVLQSRGVTSIFAEISAENRPMHHLLGQVGGYQPSPNSRSAVLQVAFPDNQILDPEKNI
jgi:ribosomal protein S18 acetylase RimI-like enzyme